MLKPAELVVLDDPERSGLTTLQPMLFVCVLRISMDVSNTFCDVSSENWFMPGLNSTADYLLLQFAIKDAGSLHCVAFCPGTATQVKR